MWNVLLLVCSSVVILIAVGLCLCGRRKTQKSQVGSNPRRSLPDIPLEGVRDVDGVAYEPSGDNFSELYATVEPYQNGAKAHMLSNSAPSRPSISQHSSISQADEALSPYARVREHPYDKLRKTEHPYASVKSASQEHEDPDSSGEATPRTSLLRSENSQNMVEPVAPPRSRRSSSHNSTCADIPAASAVAGGIPANQELPYMTPPIAQTNFSGDSQDSSKGYTSITVREPLANIRAQTKEQTKMSTEGDPHYSTVSDDSDEMYTTIQDPNNPLYTSGSETYAQIQPLQITVAAEVNAVPQGSVSPSGSLDPNYELAPQPPSVDSLKHVTQSHSRQASNSSSVGVLGSPKPEKRQANSPLPAPPPGNLDDMYAKVHKGNKNKNRPENSTGSSSPNNEGSRRSSGASSRTSFENVASHHHRASVRSSQSDNHVTEEKEIEEHDYETLKKTSYTPRGNKEWPKSRQSDPFQPGYDTINSPPSLAESDPGYEVVKSERGPRASSSSEQNWLPNPSGSDIYVKRPLASSANALMDGYSVVNKKKTSPSNASSSFGSDTPRDISTTEEPNYESMPSESFSEHNYAVLKSGGSDTDPNYESVNHNDPNYESVKYLDVGMLDEPPYERLHDDDSSRTDSREVPGYERVGNSLNSKGSDNEQGDMPDYETLPQKRTNNVVNSGLVGGGDEDLVVQV
ncbi:hyphal wall protein 2 isoform X2 [Agrilus planipennis]|uniref:Hyphal wall protein 2 isoform X2 n=1 Tax=Agrilus planipennis TaxID=224129 RepID=A0A1W4XG68_AGRPL|nr:hyphal wall protein 2 isoform X2 [Agrilus planipennis]